MDLRYSLVDVRRGILIYSIGDSVAALILGQFMWSRLLGMMLVGGAVYALEIPAWFRWIDIRTAGIESAALRACARTGLALLYFNPLWIARHLLFIAIFSGNWDTVGMGLLRIAVFSWLVNIPIAIIGNAIVQVFLPLRWRFFGSALFSGLMAIYYAVSGVLFDGGK